MNNKFKPGRGRRQNYYEITQPGLQLLIIDEPIHPLKFWKAILGYCHHYDGNMSEEKFNELYLQFRNKYLKHTNHGFSFQLEIFDNMRDEWFDNYILNNTDNKVNLAQNVLEVLALYPKLSLEEIVEKTQASQSEINLILSTYTLDSYSPLKEQTYYIHQNVIGKRSNRKYWDFLLHNTIISKEESKDNIKTYELSLFGVILALTLIRYNDMDKLKHGLYYNDISFIEYFEKIVANYKDKLPLIFGKWKGLKNILRLYAAYNFDVIIDKEIRLRDYDKFSVIRGGNKELLDGIREIMLQTRQQIGRFIDTGEAIWLNYISGARYGYEGPENQHGDYLIKNDIDVSGKQPDQQRVHLVRKRLVEIMILLNPVECGFSESIGLSPKVITQLSQQLEQLFADEITTFYYFHLYFDFEFYTRVSEPMKYYHTRVFGNTSGHQDNHGLPLRPISSRPKDCLTLILQSDKERPLISEWFYRWIHDITNLQNEIHGYLKLHT
jgi:hypothetical protein